MITGNWEGDENGILVLSAAEFSEPAALIQFVGENDETLTKDELCVLGSLSLFMMIRELGPKKGPNVISAADRGLGSFGPQTKDVRRGIDSLVERLAPVRSEDQYSVRMAAFRFVKDDLRKVGWEESAA